MTPILVKAIQELNLKIENFASDNSETSLRTRLVTWFADVGNGIQKLFTKELRTELLCVGETCVTETEFLQLLQNQSVTTPTIQSSGDELNDLSDLNNSDATDIENESGEESSAQDIPPESEVSNQQENEIIEIEEIIEVVNEE